MAGAINSEADRVVELLLGEQMALMGYDSSGAGTRVGNGAVMIDSSGAWENGA